MSLEQWRAVSEVADAALDLPAPERAAFIRQKCAGDAGLLQEVQRYLECCEKASATPGFLTANAGAYAEAMIEDLAVRTTQAESTIPAKLTTALNGRYAFERERRPGSSTM